MEINYNASLLLILSILLFGCVQEQAGAENANLSPTQPENVAGFATLESGDESGGTGTGEYTQPAPSGTGTGTGTAGNLPPTLTVASISRINSTRTYCHFNDYDIFSATGTTASGAI